MEDKTELDLLKEQADAMDVDYHPSIGMAKLQAKVNESLGIVEEVAPEAKAAIVETKAARKKRVKDEATKLIRCRVTCMDPQFKDYQGQIFSVGNRTVGTLRKFVMFGVDYHVPQMMLNMIQRKQFQSFSNGKDSRGRPQKLTSKQKTYAVEILEPLTEQELKDLSQRQQMASGTIAA